MNQPIIENYYRINIYLPILDNIIADLQYRFNKNTMNLFNFNTKIPNILLTITNEDFDFTKIMYEYYALLLQKEVFLQ